MALGRTHQVPTWCRTPQSEVETAVGAAAVVGSTDILDAVVVADGAAHLGLGALAVADGLVGDLPAVGAGDTREVHIAAVGRSHRIAVDDLEVAVAEDGCLGATLCK